MYNLTLFFYVDIGSLAALGAFLEVVADQLKAAPGTSSAVAESAHAVTPILAIGLVAAAVGVYLLTLWWLHRHIARGQAQLGWAWGAALAILVVVVAAVAAGLPLAGAIPAVTLAPAVIIVVIERGRLARPDLYSVQ